MNEFFKKPVVKILMLKGEKGDKGDTGAGFPKGGKTGQYLQKKSNADYDFRWSDITTVPWNSVTGKPTATTTTAGMMSADDKAKLDNLQVGGRNLYLDTKSFDNQSVWKNFYNWQKTGETYNGLTVIKCATAWGGCYQDIDVKAGEVYTFSVYTKSKSDKLRFYIAAGKDGEATLDRADFKINPSEEFTRQHCTFTVITGGFIRPKINIATNDALSEDDVVEICGMKLERGTVATDWTPAPEDVENEIKALNSVTKNFTLSASSWSSGSYTISDALITATSNQEVLPATNITADQYDALASAKIVDGGQSAGKMILKSLGVVPSADIPIRVIFRGEK